MMKEFFLDCAIPDIQRPLFKKKSIYFCLVYTNVEKTKKKNEFEKNKTNVKLIITVWIYIKFAWYGTMKVYLG